MPKLRVRDIEMYYEEAGQGPPLLFVHGLGSSTRDWEYQVPEFSKRYRCITYDARGHGETEKAAGPYSLAQFGADAAGLLRELDCGPVHVVGVSMGGMIAFQLAVDAPGLVRSLVICNAGPELLLPRIQDKLMLAVRLFVIRVQGMDAVGRKLAQEMFPRPDQAELRQKVAARWAENDRRCYLDSIRALVGWSVADRLDRVACPVLVVRGEGDDTPMDVTDAHLARMPDARRMVIADSLHATPADQAERFNRIVLDFLAGVDS